MVTPWRSPLAPQRPRAPASKPAPHVALPPPESVAASPPGSPTVDVDPSREPAPLSAPLPVPKHPPGLASTPTPATAPMPTAAAPAAPIPGDAEPENPAVAEPRRRDGETTWSRLAGDVVAAAELAEELEQDLEATRRELMDSRKAQRRAEQERDEAVEARFTAKTVLEALKLAEACFPDRLVVLPSARTSAETSPYRDPERIFESLALLAFFGRNDGDCEAAFHKVTGAAARWKPKDSPETSSRFGPQRTWADSEGKRKLFRRHITLGHGVDAQRCAQIYYDIASDGRVELAWVGEHRPTVSEDT